MTTIPAEAIRALNLTGSVVTINGKIQGKVLTVEGDDWTIIANEDGTITIDLDCTRLFYLQDPSVRYSRQDLHTGEIVHEWTTLSHVTRGICLAK